VTHNNHRSYCRSSTVYNAATWTAGNVTGYEPDAWMSIPGQGTNIPHTKRKWVPLILTAVTCRHLRKLRMYGDLPPHPL
jgi:hypothetical protein